MASNSAILVVDPDPVLRDRFRALLETQGHRVLVAEGGESALEALGKERIDLVLADLRIQPSGGIHLLETLKKEHPETMIILMTGRATTESVIESLRKGAHDYLIKPIAEDELLLIVARAVFRRRMGETRKRAAEQLELERERNSLHLRDQNSGFGLEAVIGHSQAMKPIRDLLSEVIQADSTILLTGESGTGKGVLARIIHYNSPRRDKPFVEANCGIYSEGVLQSELFGHEKGSFTGALKQKRGRFELAHEGTIFLDEIGDLSAGTQLMLLRILQERRFERVGGEETIHCDVRIIAATNCDLEQRMKTNRFRSDLFYRLNVIPIAIPPLRERKEDIPYLGMSILERCARKMGKNMEGFSPEAMTALVNYSWPGNIRELENLIERTLILVKTSTIKRSDLPIPVCEKDVSAPSEWPCLIDHERSYIIRALRKCGGNKKQTASLLGINRSSLYSKIKRLGISNGNGMTGPVEGETGGFDRVSGLQEKGLIPEKEATTEP
ncbi:MAG: sigma-54 dependent transcriptional regulator [Acidobacteriota bacterium]